MVGSQFTKALDYDYPRYPPPESRFSPPMEMPELGRSISQPLPPGMAQYRTRYMPPMHNPSEHPPVYYEGPPRYMGPPPPRMGYARPVPEYGPGYNGAYQNPPSFPPMRPQSPVLYHLDPGAMPYIPARYVPPPPGNLRAEPAKPRPVTVSGPPAGMMPPQTNPPSAPLPAPGFAPPRARSPMPPFYLGTNKKQVSTDGISDEERKAFGIEKFLAELRMRKGPIGTIEQGADVTMLGLKLNSPEYILII